MKEVGCSSYFTIFCLRKALYLYLDYYEAAKKSFVSDFEVKIWVEADSASYIAK